MTIFLHIAQVKVSTLIFIERFFCYCQVTGARKRKQVFKYISAPKRICTFTWSTPLSGKVSTTAVPNANSDNHQRQIKSLQDKVRYYKVKSSKPCNGDKLDWKLWLDSIGT